MAARAVPVMMEANAAQLKGRQNLHPECEAAINNLINMKLYTSYVFISMSYYFKRADQDLKNVTQLFRRLSHEARDQAEKFMVLQNLRGGQISPRIIDKPDKENWRNSLKALTHGLHLMRVVNQNLISLYQLASDKKDPHLCAYLEKHFLDQQARSIKEFADYINSLLSSGAPEDFLTDCHFDMFTLGRSGKTKTEQPPPQPSE